MFKVDIDISLKVKDCPADGLAAVDFRTAHGLPPAPTNDVRVTYRADADEVLCRALAWALNDAADLVIQTGRPPYMYDFAHGSSGSLNSNPHRHGSCGTAVNFRVPADLLRPFTSGSAGAPDVASLIAELGVQTAHFAGEHAAREKAKELEDAERKRAAVERDAADKARRQSHADRKAAEMAAWVSSHGSDRLKACVANGWECGAVYRDERLAVEYPGWQFDGGQVAAWSEPRNPPAEAVKLFEEACGKIHDDAIDTAKLVYWTHDDSSGYAVQCDLPWADKSGIVYGYTGPDLTEDTDD